MTFPVRAVLFLALVVAGIMLAIFVIKTALAVALIGGVLFAALYFFNFARAFARRLGQRTLPPTLR